MRYLSHARFAEGQAVPLQVGDPPDPGEVLLAVSEILP
jgi:hypothetical protein